MEGQAAVDPLAHQSAACELRAETCRDGDPPLLVDCVVVLAGEHPSVAASLPFVSTKPSVGPVAVLANSRAPSPGPTATPHCPTVLQTRARARRRDQQPTTSARLGRVRGRLTSPPHFAPLGATPAHISRRIGRVKTQIAKSQGIPARRCGVDAEAPGRRGPVRSRYSMTIGW